MTTRAARSTRTRRIMAAIAVLAMAAGACGRSSDGDAVASVPATQVDGEALATSERRAATPVVPDVASPPATPAPAARTGESSPTMATRQTPEAAPTPRPVTTPDLPTGIEDPVRLEIPSIGVDADIVDLSLGNGNPEVPQDWQDAGWYATTRNPGEIGPAVIAGHIDSKSGPAVFFRLDQLAAGDQIVVHGANGASATFRVTGASQYPKTDLPAEVFGFGDPRPELRLITCGGSFDRNAGHYVDNLVVYAAAA